MSDSKASNPHPFKTAAGAAAAVARLTPSTQALQQALYTNTFSNNAQQNFTQSIHNPTTSHPMFRPTARNAGQGSQQDTPVATNFQAQIETRHPSNSSTNWQQAAAPPLPHQTQPGASPNGPPNPNDTSITNTYASNTNQTGPTTFPTHSGPPYATERLQQ
ncbi:hypothetical protein PCASD_15278 [Puccinia coronata f. sp. avenae]|uniref:Uncharacterized protein n=1 Tax=Puccinia coronata f. sp. avenae TaxID=200324 RepID=A0A2N5SJM7_9BASI|nr:hypothetical protein PCASD_20520 [Puccinia coronata f. sp. avenae]PLW36853.1 hypothetical protein PCASD_15278 [Puccinia coronata f. sp. avenae]